MASHDLKRQNEKVGPHPHVQYVEDFKIWVNVEGRPHRLQEKEIAKCFVSGLKPEIKETFPRVWQLFRK